VSETNNKHGVKAMNKLLIKISDMLNGNAKRRRTIKQRLTVAMMQTETSKMEWKRKEFIRMYETFERTPLEALPSSLPGLVELSEAKAAGPVALNNLSLGVAKWRNGNGQ